MPLMYSLLTRALRALAIPATVFFYTFLAVSAFMLTWWAGALVALLLGVAAYFFLSTALGVVWDRGAEHGFEAGRQYERLASRMSEVFSASSNDAVTAARRASYRVGQAAGYAAGYLDGVAATSRLLTPPNDGNHSDDPKPADRSDIGEGLASAQIGI